ncbi:MAG: bifunctional 4-hydroxy-2-oxoglutarate aldolase/2-dehydro-3-deoxy-phosphogluconate aldolase [Kineosporiaceae bacterium]
MSSEQVTEPNGDQVTERIVAHRVVPVVSIEDERDAEPIGQALADGGLPVIEVTFRTAAAAASIARLRAACPDLLVGAGTVLDAATARTALAAGAQFLVAPGFDEPTLEVGRGAGVPVVPGAVTPTELQRLLAHGLNLVKFFPAEASGGRAMLAALAGPFPTARFMPTGGITPQNLPEYLALPTVAACGGTWIVTANTVRQRRFDEITDRARDAVTRASSTDPDQ